MPPPNPSSPNGTGREPGPEGRPDARRLILETAGVVAASLFVLIPLFHLPIVDPDEGIIAFGAERILGGEVPYRDFFSELGPASFYLQALIFKLGAINITAMRLTAWLLGGAISGLIYILARKALPTRWALAAVAIFPLICYPSAYRVSHHWWANVFLLLTVISLSASFRGSAVGEARRGAAWLLLAGALASMTLLAMQSKGFWAILMGPTFLLLEPWFTQGRDRQLKVTSGVPRAALFLAGTATALGAVAGYFASQGALGAWVDANLVFLFTNYRAYLDVPQASAIQTLNHIGRLALHQPSTHFYLYFTGYLFFFFMAPLIAFGGAAARLVAGRRDPPADSPVVLLLLLQGAGAFLSEYHSLDVPHLMWAAPLMLILFVREWNRLATGTRALKRPLQLAGVIALSLMLFTAGRKALNMSRIDGKVETRRGVIYVQPSLTGATQARVAAIEERVPVGGETFFYPYMAEMYFLTATRNPTRYDVLLKDFHRADQIEEAISSLKRARPGYVFGFDQIQLLTIRPHFPDDPPDAVRPHPVGRALAIPGSGFQLETSVEAMEVWAAKP